MQKEERRNKKWNPRKEGEENRRTMNEKRATDDPHRKMESPKIQERNNLGTLVQTKEGQKKASLSKAKNRQKQKVKN